MSISSQTVTIPQDNGSIEQKQNKAKDLPWWLGPEVIDEVKEEEEEESQKESDIPLTPVTFHFVGIRPSKAHEQNHQISTISLTKTHSISAVQIPFKTLTLNDNVNALKTLLFDEFNIPKTRQSLLIYYGDTKLSDDAQLLKHYGVTDHSTFLVAIYDNASANHYDNTRNVEPTEDELSRKRREHSRRQRDLDRAKRRLQRIQNLRNGVQPSATNDHTKKRKMKEIILLKHLLQKYKTIEMVKGFDIISQEGDVDCIPLPVCGHLLARESLYDYAASQLMNREQTLKCPHVPHTGCDNNKLCGTQWSYPLIKQCLSLNDDAEEHKTSTALDYSKLELLFARNVVELRYDVQKCGECKSLLYRNPKDHNFDCRTECPLCASSVFCWGCSEIWSDEHQCDTSFRAATMEILAKCPLKSVGPAKQCPSVRACPKCNQLIQHVSACKHMKCTFCKTNFCFICLKPQENNSWKCGSYSDKCPTHKRQNYTLLPKLNQTSFSVF